jgi:HTH-type transcriptional regulator/antitoxin HigA
MCYDELHAFTTRENGINRFIEALADAGVILFVLPHLKKTYLDGAAFFSGNNPVIVYTGRYKRIDNFWFTVAHEIAHILLHLNEAVPFVLDNLKDSDHDQLEKEANALAAAKLKHSEIKDYLQDYIQYLPISKVEECALRYNIHQAVIVGKMAHDDAISYKNLARYNENVLDLIDPKYKF